MWFEWFASDWWFINRARCAVVFLQFLFPGETNELNEFGINKWIVENNRSVPKRNLNNSLKNSVNMITHSHYRNKFDSISPRRGSALLALWHSPASRFWSSQIAKQTGSAERRILRHSQDAVGIRTTVVEITIWQPIKAIKAAVLACKTACRLVDSKFVDCRLCTRLYYLDYSPAT